MSSPQGGRGPADLGTVVRCFRENAVAKHSPCMREARFAAAPRYCPSAICKSGPDRRRSGGERPAARERPPGIGPRMRSRSVRGGRSRDSSFQEGGAAPKGHGGVRRRYSDCHAPLSVHAVRVEVQCLVVWSFDCGDSLGLRLPSTNWASPVALMPCPARHCLMAGRRPPRAVPSMSDNPILIGPE